MTQTPFGQTYAGPLLTRTGWRRGRCPGCGEYVSRRHTFSARVPEGGTRAEVYAELDRQRAEWIQGPAAHEACES